MGFEEHPVGEWSLALRYRFGDHSPRAKKNRPQEPIYSVSEKPIYSTTTLS